MKGSVNSLILLFYKVQSTLSQWMNDHTFHQLITRVNFYSSRTFLFLKTTSVNLSKFIPFYLIEIIFSSVSHTCKFSDVLLELYRKWKNSFPTLWNEMILENVVPSVSRIFITNFELPGLQMIHVHVLSILTKHIEDILTSSNNDSRCLYQALTSLNTTNHHTQVQTHWKNECCETRC